MTANAPTCGSRRIRSLRSLSKPPNKASQQSMKPSICSARVRTTSVTVSTTAGSRDGTVLSFGPTIENAELTIRSTAARIPPRISPTTGNQARADAIPFVASLGATGRIVRKPMAECKLFTDFSTKLSGVVFPVRYTRFSEGRHIGQARGRNFYDWHCQNGAGPFSKTHSEIEQRG